MTNDIPTHNIHRDLKDSHYQFGYSDMHDVNEICNSYLQQYLLCATCSW